MELRQPEPALAGVMRPHVLLDGQPRWCLPPERDHLLRMPRLIALPLQRACSEHLKVDLVSSAQVEAGVLRPRSSCWKIWRLPSIARTASCSSIRVCWPAPPAAVYRLQSDRDIQKWIDFGADLEALRLRAAG